MLLSLYFDNWSCMCHQQQMSRLVFVRLLPCHLNLLYQRRVLLQLLLQTCCNQSRHLHAGWVPTPNRLPSATPLTHPSDDPKIQEGLRQILQLDERLMQKSVEATMVARETFPDTWSAADKKQAERDQKLLLASLERC